MSIHAATLAPPSAPRFAAPPPLALYVHIPWCLKKCPYCDFNSHERGRAIEALPEARYVDALLADLEFALPSIWGRRVGSIFFGGGTPSLFGAESIDRALAGIRARVPVAPDAEVTLEANPGTFEQEKFAGFKAAGVNRLSLGIQSFDPRHLRALGRVHDEREAHAATAAALAIFDNVNLDLMYALPGQTPEQARGDVMATLAYGAPHLSFYHLTIEPNTLFHRHPPPLPDDDTAAQIGDETEEALAAAGYLHYETSAFARAGRECRHNLNYWRFGDYLGIGAGAHSKLSFPERVLRQVRYKQPEQYLAQVERGSPLLEEREVTRGEIGFEFMLNALRLAEGVPVALFAERTGFPLALIDKELTEAERRGLLERDHQRVGPSVLGRRFLNDLQALFLPPPNRRVPGAPPVTPVPLVLQRERNKALLPPRGEG
jgi:oxygen-independent coproporphyrinogen-3 oxidase